MRHAGTMRRVPSPIVACSIAAKLPRIVSSWSLLKRRPSSTTKPSPPARSSAAASRRVLPNTMVEFGVKDGVGCDMSHFSAAELQGKIMPDEHVHEHATCFNVKDRGLVVISSCGHVGIVNSVRQAQEVSGVQKVHAIVGGFHLGPAPIGVSRSGRGRYQEAGTRRGHPDALQRRQFHRRRCANRCPTSSCWRRSAAASSSAR